MNKDSYILSALSNRKALLYGIIFGLFGFAGNWFKFELFFNVDFLFGSFFVMLAIIRFGAVSGVVAGCIAASCTFLLWNHPWAIIIMTAEAAFISWQFKKEKTDCLTLDIIFWLTIGTPLVWFFYYFILHVGAQSTLLIVLKQSINGVFNAMIASAVHLALRLKSSNSEEYPSFQEVLFITMVMIILIPSFFYLNLKVRDEITTGLEQISESAIHTTTAARSSIDQWLRVHHQDVKLLASLIGSTTEVNRHEMQRYVDLVKQSSPSFLRMGVLDRDAVIVAYSPQMQNGIKNIGQKFADRPYIPIIKQTLKPYIPDMVPGKLATQIPILPLIVPLVDKNGYAGYCAGVTDLSQMKKILSELVTRQHENISVLDRNGNVVVSTRDDLKSMDHFPQPTSGTIQQIKNGYYHWIPETQKGSSIMSRWMSSLYISETIINSELPWRVVVELSPRPMLSKLTTSSINAFLMMASLIVLSALFARFISSKYVKSLQALQQETEHIPEVLDDYFPKFVNNQSRIRELYRLNENFRRMMQVLHSKMKEISQANMKQLLGIEKETKLLHEKEMLVKDLHDGIGGLMTKISMLAQYAQTTRNYDIYNEVMDKILALSYEGGVEVRSFMNSLESEQSAWGDLLAEIAEHCERMFEHDHPRFTISSSISKKAPCIGVFRHVNLVRIFREAVANILKHSQANNVKITFLVTNQQFNLLIADDGIGYDVMGVRKRGIANMFSRGKLIDADISIESSPSGTSIGIELSLENLEKEN